MPATSAILAIDQGTTSTKVLAFGDDGTILARGSSPNAVSYPRPGWAEQSPGALWDGVANAVAETVAQLDGTVSVAGVAISNQRETVVLWDAGSGEPIGPCVTWQCRRTSQACRDLRDAGMASEIAMRTGLALDPMFSATKIAWLLDHEPGVRARAERGELRAGTIDTWLIRNLTGGGHLTDLSNASRTQLLNLDTLAWDPWLADVFRVPMAILPEIRASDGMFGETAGTTCLPDGIPIIAAMGDSHAALFGHGVDAAGAVKVTCGTGSSLMSVTGQRIISSNQLSGTIAWSRSGEALHALEGNISVSGKTAAFAAELLGLPDEEALTDLAATVQDTDGVVLVPAFAGLGAPHWLDHARGLITGMTLGTRPAHVARAALEAIALQIADVLSAMEADLGLTFPFIHVDGGASGSDFLMQLLADLTDRPVRRGAVAELSAYGVARMAAISLGKPWATNLEAVKVFGPSMAPRSRLRILARWRDAVARAGAPSICPDDNPDPSGSRQGLFGD